MEGTLLLSTTPLTTTTKTPSLSTSCPQSFRPRRITTTTNAWFHRSSVNLKSKSSFLSPVFCVSSSDGGGISSDVILLDVKVESLSVGEKDAFNVSWICVEVGGQGCELGGWRWRNSGEAVMEQLGRRPKGRQVVCGLTWLTDQGMMCGGCTSSVKRILENQAQVSSADVDLATETATVYPVSEAKVTPNWQKVIGEELAKNLTNCGFNSTLKGEAATEG